MDATDSLGPLGVRGRKGLGDANKDISAGRVNEAIRIGLAVYRVTQKFPSDEPLREKLRQLVIESVASSAHLDRQNGLQVFSQLVALLRLASPLGFAAPENFTVLISAYRSLWQHWPQLIEQQSQKAARFAESHTGATKSNRAAEEGVRSRRQANILAILRQDGSCRLRDFSSALAGVSARTIRRDLNDLCQGGLIMRQGFGASSMYFLVRQSGA
ncbi:DeoR family transcriptional regulator [Candidatus Parcubacteria bacterium]|nr:DeoR family transcriptional regulator [Candidatus Parcubacteria bacterium]